MFRIDIMPDHEKYRIRYVLLFCSILIFSLILTIIIYYLVRHKKKYHFDASGILHPLSLGRKVILTQDEYPQLISKLTGIIQADDRGELERLVYGMITLKQGFSLGILFIKNELNQTLLHLAAFHGALKCLVYILYFNLINPNQFDSNNRFPLYYAITNLQTEDDKNKLVLVHLLKVTNISQGTPEGDDIIQLMTDWQRELVHNPKDIYLVSD